MSIEREECAVCDDYTALHGITHERVTYWLCRNCLGCLLIYRESIGLGPALDRWGLREGIADAA